VWIHQNTRYRTLDGRASLQLAVVVHRERAAAEIVGPGFRDHGHGRAARHPLLGIEAVGGDIHFLDAFHGGGRTPRGAAA
jgi:hypothetical protein